MKLTPLEVETETFSRRLRGYDPAEVDAFKRLVAVRLEELIRENASLREEIARSREELQALRDREKGIQETLYTARQLSDEMQGQARREADIVRAEAELQGEAIRREAERELGRMRRELDQLKMQRARWIGDLKGAIEGHLRLLEVHEETLLGEHHGGQQRRSGQSDVQRERIPSPKAKEPPRTPPETKPAPSEDDQAASLRARLRSKGAGQRSAASVPSLRGILRQGGAGREGARSTRSSSGSAASSESDDGQEAPPQRKTPELALVASNPEPVSAEQPPSELAEEAVP